MCPAHRHIRKLCSRWCSWRIRCAAPNAEHQKDRSFVATLCISERINYVFDATRERKTTCVLLLMCVCVCAGAATRIHSFSFGFRKFRFSLQRSFGYGARTAIGKFFFWPNTRSLAWYIIELIVPQNGSCECVHSRWKAVRLADIDRNLCHRWPHS